MDAREYLAGLVDAPRRAGLHLVERAAPGAVDRGEAKEVDRHAVPPPEIEPGLLRRAAAAPALAGRAQRRGLVDQPAGAVSIDARGGEIARPDEVRRACRDGATVPRGDGIARRVRRHRADEMGGPAERRRDRPVAVEEMGIDPLPREGVAVAVAAAGPGHRPAEGAQASRQDEGAVAEAETEEARGLRRRGGHRRRAVIRRFPARFRAGRRRSAGAVAPTASRGRRARRRRRPAGAARTARRTCP